MMLPVVASDISSSGSSSFILSDNQPSRPFSNLTFPLAPRESDNFQPTAMTAAMQPYSLLSNIMMTPTMPDFPMGPSVENQSNWVEVPQLEQTLPTNAESPTVVADADDRVENKGFNLIFTRKYLTGILLLATIFIFLAAFMLNLSLGLTLILNGLEPNLRLIQNKNSYSRTNKYP